MRLLTRPYGISGPEARRKIHWSANIFTLLLVNIDQIPLTWGIFFWLNEIKSPPSASGGGEVGQYIDRCIIKSDVASTTFKQSQRLGTLIFLSYQTHKHHDIAHVT